MDIRCVSVISIFVLCQRDAQHHYHLSPACRCVFGDTVILHVMLTPQILSWKFFFQAALLSAFSLVWVSDDV